MVDMQSVIASEYSKIFIGLVDLSRAVKDYATSPHEKMQAMEEMYLQGTSEYTEVERKQIKYFREAFAYKFYLANLHLEQLWSLAHSGKQPLSLKKVLTNIYDAHQFSDDNLLLPSFAIEGFIIQGAAFLDFYMLHICSVFKVNDTNHLSGRKFIKALEQVKEEPYKARAEQVRIYFAEKIFDDSNQGALLAGNWGGLLKNLRNSLVHRDMLYPDFRNDVSLLEKIIGEWPTRDVNLTYSGFCQDAQNVMFYLITELIAVVYGLEYKPGRYKPGMW